MLNGEGIDTSTGLPDLSLLGDDHYWEVVRSESFGWYTGTYTLRLMRKIKSKRVLRTDKITYNIVGESVIQRKKSFDELSKETVRKLERYISAYKITSTPEKLFSDYPTTKLLDGSICLSNRIHSADLMEYNLSEDLIQLCALNVYNEVLESKTRALKKEMQTKANDKFLGTYPPNKLGSSVDNGS